MPLAPTVALRSGAATGGLTRARALLTSRHPLGQRGPLMRGRSARADPLRKVCSSAHRRTIRLPSAAWDRRALEAARTPEAREMSLTAIRGELGRMLERMLERHRGRIPGGLTRPSRLKRRLAEVDSVRAAAHCAIRAGRSRWVRPVNPWESPRVQQFPPARRTTLQTHPKQENQATPAPRRVFSEKGPQAATNSLAGAGDSVPSCSCAPPRGQLAAEARARPPAMRKKQEKRSSDSHRQRLRLARPRFDSVRLLASSGIEREPTNRP